MKFYKSKDADAAVKYLQKVISEHLKKGEKILWLVTGGSAIEVAAEVSKLIKNEDLSRLYITLTDERYGAANHSESNWRQLLDAGFKLPQAQLFPLLNGEDVEKTAMNYSHFLEELLHESDYKISLFGMGPDGHIASLFPGFPQLEEDQGYALSVEDAPKPPPQRITMTIPAIKELDEAVLYVRGEERRALLEKLKQEVSINEQPAQILKGLPKFTIFNDQIGEEV
jgi:6-phosphogluconolactonase